MICYVCKRESKIIQYQRDDPILECGHLQASDMDARAAEQVCYDSEILTARLMSERGLTREEAQEEIIRGCLNDMPRPAAVQTVRTLKAYNLTSEGVEEFISGLTPKCQKYVNNRGQSPFPPAVS